MRTMKLLFLAVGLLTLTLTGCAYDDDHHDSASMVIKDVCPHCPGDQDMTASGTCEKCGMKVDVCSACPGMQTMAADQTCPACGMKVTTG
jgi:hypothetical protein